MQFKIFPKRMTKTNQYESVNKNKRLDIGRMNIFSINYVFVFGNST